MNSTYASHEDRERKALKRAVRFDRRLAIALVTDTYAPQLNGIALTVERAVRYLRDSGHRVEVVHPIHAEAGEAQDDELLVKSMRVPGSPRLRVGMPALWKLLHHWRRRRPEVVHIATEGPLGWSALFAARMLSLPVSSDYRMHYHDHAQHYGLGAFAGPVQAALREFHRRTDATFVPTTLLVEELGAKGYGNVFCVGRGVDASLFHPARRNELLRRRWGLSERGLAVLYVGRLAAEKNISLARTAFSALRRLRPDARLIWVGDGLHAEGMKEGEVYAGLQREVALAQHYASADLFLFPSETDTFGNVTLEAMASGLPIVAFDCGAAWQHLLDGVNARLIALGDSRSFVAAAVELSLDAAQRRMLGAAARRVAETLNWRMALRLFEVHLGFCAARGVART
jgi:glycosyltransferase involved in cell wall biosynthesis